MGKNEINAIIACFVYDVVIFLMEWSHRFACLSFSFDVLSHFRAKFKQMLLRAHIHIHVSADNKCNKSKTDFYHFGLTGTHLLFISRIP